MPSPPEKSRGILNPHMSGRKFRLARHAPSPDLTDIVEFYWSVAWDLPTGDTYTQETLPYPSVHLVFEAGNTRVWGVMTGKFARRLAGKGHVFAVKFMPAGFYSLWRRPVAQLTNASPVFRDVFGSGVDELESAILSQPDEGKMVALAERFLRERLAGPDERVAQINRIVACIATRREITRVDDVAARFGLSARTLQRLFRQYVGIGPKWVIQRHRLHEVAERLDAGERMDWPCLAVELGYADQTHLIKDFKAIVGATPAEYARRTATSREG